MVLKPFGDGLAVATGPRASEDDGNPDHEFSLVFLPALCLYRKTVQSLITFVA
jgi:hypothetical protein